MEIKEIEIPVPWGVIAAKCWGDEKNRMVIVLHGYKDNAGSFDRLIPLLPDTFYYVCIDLPSHGRSSHFLTKTFVSFFDIMTSLKLVMNHLKQKKYILMGHSYGAQTALHLTQIFPELVTKLVLLDAFTYMPIPTKHVYNEWRGMMMIYKKQLAHTDEKCPTYTREEAVQRMLDTRFTKIKKDSAEILLERALIPVGNNKFKISTGQHLKRMLRMPFSAETQAELLKYYPIYCPMLVIMANKSIVYDNYKKYLQKGVKTKHKFIFKVVPGDHDVHLEYPEHVAPDIKQFLLKEFNETANGERYTFTVGPSFSKRTHRFSLKVIEMNKKCIFHNEMATNLVTIQKNLSATFNNCERHDY